MRGTKLEERIMTTGFPIDGTIYAVEEIWETLRGDDIDNGRPTYPSLSSVRRALIRLERRGRVERVQRRPTTPLFYRPVKGEHIDQRSHQETARKESANNAGGNR